jgi:hypothetical protein
MMIKRLLLIASIPLAWFAFAILWWAPHQFAEVFVEMGAELPYPTAWVIDLSASGAPLLAGLVYTAVALWTLLRPTPRRTWLQLALAVLLAIWLAVALGAMTIPFQKCGFHWPNLPWQAPSGQSSCCTLD